MMKRKTGRSVLLLILAVLLGLTGCSTSLPRAEMTEVMTTADIPTVTRAGEGTETAVFASEESGDKAGAEDEAASEGLSEAETVRESSTEEKTETAPAPDEEAPEASEETEASADGISVTEDGEYTDKEHVALYIHLYGKMPCNYITKKEANALGWESGDLYPYAEGKSIGGSSFGNYEKRLPEKKGRRYYECDIDYHGGKRNACRIVYSDDGLVYYTGDHYETFELLYD